MEGRRPPVDNDRFFDRSPPRSVQPGFWRGETPRPVRHQADRFFPHEAERDDHGDLHSLAARIGRQPYAFAGILLLFGFFAVFIRQAPFLYQLILGAPIFEEALKFGLALMIAWPLRYLGLRLPVAWAVGAAFGYLEHVVTYSEESTVLLVERLAFHAGATGLSMVSYQALVRSRDARVVWGSTLLSTGWHYLNNFLAIPFAVVTALADAPEWVAASFAFAVTGAVYVTTVVLVAAGGRYRRWTERRVARLRSR